MYKLQHKDDPQRGLWLVGEKICLGAGLGNELVLDGLGISDRHAQIVIEQDRVKLEMIEGQCLVNELPVDGSCELVGNDEIRIGQHRLIVLDSKQLEKKQTRSNFNDPDHSLGQKSSENWALVAIHPRLKERNFTIIRSAVIGRGKGSDFLVPYKLLSREHARFTVDEQGLLVTDLDSSNGTFVNNKRVKQARLKGGETLSFAKLGFTVHAPQTAEANTAAASEVNRTMIRPALTREVVLQQIVETNEDAKVTLEIQTEVKSATQESKPVIEQPSHRGRWLALAVVLAGLAVACWWLLPLIKALIKLPIN